MLKIIINKYRSLNYIQYGITHKIIDRNKIKLQGIKKALKVRGVNQLKNKEIANVILCNTPKGYYIRVTTFVDKKDADSTNTNKRIIGIDFGCQTSLTTSEGSKIKVEIKETDRLKKLQKSLSGLSEMATVPMDQRN